MKLANFLLKGRCLEELLENIMLLLQQFQHTIDFFVSLDREKEVYELHYGCST